MPGPAAFVGDFHACPMVGAATGAPHVGGAILSPMDPTFLLMGMPIAGMGSTAQCCATPPIDTVAMGVPTFVAISPVSGMGAVTAHGGTIPMGDPTFIVA